MSGPDNPRTPLSQLPVQSRSSVTERPRHQVGDGSQAFAYCDPALRFVNPERMPLGAIIFPQTVVDMRLMLERIGFLQVAAEDDIVAPPADDADEIRRDHVAAGVEAWQNERPIIEPLLCQWLWNTMWSWIARRPGKAVRVDMVAILVDQPHEVTGRVQVSARMRISTAQEAGRARGPSDAVIRQRVRALTSGTVDEE